MSRIRPSLVLTTPLAGIISPLAVMILRSLLRLEISSPLAVIELELKGAIGAAGTPPLPLTIKLLAIGELRSLLQACTMVRSAFTGLAGNSVVPRMGLMSEVLMTTSPSKLLSSELALISLVRSLKGRSVIPKIDSALILILPPSPRWALAIISLLPSGKAMIKSVSIVKLPPLASLKALAEIELPPLKVKLRSRLRKMLPPSPEKVSAVILTPSSKLILDAAISIMPALPCPKLVVLINGAAFVRLSTEFFLTRIDAAEILILPALPTA